MDRLLNDTFAKMEMNATEIERPRNSDARSTFQYPCSHKAVAELPPLSQELLHLSLAIAGATFIPRNK